METKRCKQCGEVKPIEQYRKYYGKSTGTYSVCRSCETINSRVKYLRRKGTKATEADKAELAKAEQLYEMQRACGLKPPRRRNASKASLDNLIDVFSEHTKNKAVVPGELSSWLTADLTDTPEYYMDIVYEQLIEAYRPVLKIDQSTLNPVYDDTYRDILDKILSRFCAYEDTYYNQEDN